MCGARHQGREPVCAGQRFPRIGDASPYEYINDWRLDVPDRFARVFFEHLDDLRVHGSG